MRLGGCQPWLGLVRGGCTAAVGVVDAPGALGGFVGVGCRVRVWGRGARLRLALAALSPYPAPEHTLVQVTNAEVAALVGFPKPQRVGRFVRLCTMQHLRRYLLALGPVGLRMHVEGAVVGFAGLWAALGRPTGGVWAHPKSEAGLQVADVCYGPAVGGAAVQQHLEGLGAGSAYAGVWAWLTAQRRTGAALHAGVWWRYVLTWVQLVAHPRWGGAGRRPRRARSLRRRLVKRLVRQTQTRFGV